MKYVLKEQWLNTMNYEPSEYLRFLDGCIATCKEKLLMFAAATHAWLGMTQGRKWNGRITFNLKLAR